MSRDVPVDHEINLTLGQPPIRVTTVVLEYGKMRPLQTLLLMYGGSGQLRRLPILEIATVKWTDAQGRTHEETVPIRSKVPWRMAGKRVSFEIHNDKLKAFVDTRQPNYKMSREQIYSDGTD